MSLSPLAGIHTFQSGIGDGEDLRVRVREDLEGGWFPVLTPGFYYIGADEDYLFARKVYQQETVSAAHEIQEITLSGFSADPTARGPILIRRTSTGKLLHRVSSPLRAFQPLSLSEVDGMQVASVGGLVVSVVSHPVTGVYLQVPASGDLISTEDYVYAPRTGQIYLKDEDPPSLFASWLVPDSDPEQLRLQEVVRVDRDGRVRAQYSPVSLELAPVIRKPTPTGAITVTGTAVSGNAVAFESEAIQPGDLVALEYYVRDSFSAYYADGTLALRVLPDLTGDLTIEWEGSDGYFDTSALTESHPSRIQLNPLLERQEPGFLYLAHDTVALPVPSEVRIRLADQNLVWGPQHVVPLLVETRVLDSRGDRCGRVTVTLDAQLNGTPLLSLTAQADWFGKCLFQFSPNATGTLLLTATVSGTTVSGTCEAPIHAKAARETAAELGLGKLLLHLEDQPYREGLFRLSAHYVYPDGAPFQPSSAAALTEPWRGGVTFRCGRSALYSLDGRRLGPTATLNLNADSIASVLVQPEPGDVLRAELVTPDTTRRRVARPIRVLATPSPDAEPDHVQDA